MTITITAPACVFSGFGKIAIEVFSRLCEMGHDCHFRPARIEEDLRGVKVPFPQSIRDRFVQSPKGREVVITPLLWNHLPHAEDSVILTMYESTRISNECAEVLNRYSRVIVPTNWNRAAFAHSGVSVPIDIAPLGVERSVFSPKPKDPNGICVFGAAAFLSPSMQRKNFQALKVAWEAAFAGIPNLRLFLKGMPGDPAFDFSNDDRILINNEYMEPSRLASWYQSIDVFVLTSRCEGWGLMAHEAMACGKPVVGMQFGGMENLIDRNVGFPVWGKLTAHDPNNREWGCDQLIDTDDLIDQLRRVYWDPKEMARRGSLALERARLFSWTNTAIQILASLVT